MKKQNGFTLVELAIVLMIIGLLIGGILRGQELMQNARITATVQQVKSYQAAWSSFLDTYGSYAGDMPNADVRLPGCQAGNANNCVPGNGDGMIGNTGVGAAAGQPWTDVDATIASENTQFWKHLALAHLISGINPSAATPDWGKSQPVASIGGGFFMRYANYTGNAGAGASSSHYLVLRNTITGQWQCGGGTSTGECVISPMRASLIDRKMDDGLAGTGAVIAISANWQNGCGIPNTGMNGPSGYAEGNDDKACDMMFQIQ